MSLVVTELQHDTMCTHPFIGFFSPASGKDEQEPLPLKNPKGHNFQLVLFSLCSFFIFI